MKQPKLSSPFPFACCAVMLTACSFAAGNVDLSGDQSSYAASVPVVAVDPRKSGHIAVAWRFIDPLGGSDSSAPGNWVCHVSVSEDNGRTFSDSIIDWNLPGLPRCNAPWVGFARDGKLMLMGTLTGTPPSHAVMDAGPQAQRPHPNGTVGFMAARGQAFGWDAAVSALPSNAIDRFNTDSSIPDTSKQVPWDGARGAIDLSTGTIYASGAFPAPPGSAQHSQRFFTASTDGGKSFGTIRAFGSAEWPERWDGDIAAANGAFIASYIAESTPNSTHPCPCAVVAVSHDGGKSLARTQVAGADEFDLDTLVHYPEVAVDAAHPQRFALVLISAQRDGLAVFLTSNDGRDWKRLTLKQPSDVTLVSRPALAFSPGGALVIAWRGVHGDASYDIYAAASSNGSHVGTPVKISNATSRTPQPWLKTYAVRGDFHTTVAAARDDAHIAWSDARNGRDVRIMYANVPIRELLR